jgi:hypothetical protein
MPWDRKVCCTDSRILCPALGCTSNHHVAQPSECTNSVFGIVVIPWHIVIVEECEEPDPLFCSHGSKEARVLLPDCESAAS